MKTLSLSITIAILTGLAAGTGLAKDKDKDKDHDKDRDRDQVVVVNRGGPVRDQTRTIYVVEGDRPVERVVSVDREGHYYRVVDGRRIFIRDRYFESYPEKYYYPDGRRRVTIRLPF